MLKRTWDPFDYNPLPLPRAASGYTWDSLAMLNTPESTPGITPVSLSLSFAPLRPFCPPAAGASCDPGPLSCTHGGNEGCWAVCGFAGESLGGLKCVCVTAVLYVVLSQMVKRSFLSTYSCCCLRATFPLSEFVLLWLFMPKSCQAASSAVNNLLLGSHRASLHISLPLAW